MALLLKDSECNSEERVDLRSARFRIDVRAYWTRLKPKSTIRIPRLTWINETYHI
jgi:hypothetical protein